MSNIVILGGGFAGLTAAEELSRKLPKGFKVTLISEDENFVFSPGLVKLAFGQCSLDQISFNLESALSRKGVEFIKARVKSVNPYKREITYENDTHRTIGYDYLVYALGRKLVMDRIPGFHQYAHTIMNSESALSFKRAIDQFQTGQAVIGSCPGSRLNVPVYETAFALSRKLKERGNEDFKISIIRPHVEEELREESIQERLAHALSEHRIEVIDNFPIQYVTECEIISYDRTKLPYDLLMLIPPFGGTEEIKFHGFTNNEGFIEVNEHLKVKGTERMYAVGDATNFSGPKMGHMAILQARTAAANLLSEVRGDEPSAVYDHEVRTIIDEGGKGSLYIHNLMLKDFAPVVNNNRLWHIAKAAHQNLWIRKHA
jgi:sulfide:quinone oxidoreductase